MGRLSVVTGPFGDARVDAWADGRRADGRRGWVTRG